MGVERPEDWPWSEALDAVEAAPDSHRVLLENDRVRVLRIVIPPGVTEPRHTHAWPSVMIVDQPARIRYRDETGEVTFESPEDMPHEPRPPSWLAPEGLHSVENVDDVTYLGYRVEIKGSGSGR